MKADVIVVGAGAAGLAAALTAQEAGLSVLLLDRAEGAPPGGVTARLGREVWLVRPSFAVTAIGPEGMETFEAPILILATGATERMLPFPGWTLPGVAALRDPATGSRPVVAGMAADVVETALRLSSGGAHPAAVGVAEPRSAIPDDVAEQLARLETAGIPVHHGYVVVAAEGTASLEAVVLAPAGRPDDTRLTVAADALHVSYGLVPASEVARALGGRLISLPGGSVAPAVDGWQQAESPPGLFVAGDAAGAAGDATAAVLQGALAGLGAARLAGRALPGTAERAATLRAALAEQLRPPVPPEGLLELATADTAICRCEGITAAAIDRALDEGASDIEQLKLWTHCGMGVCQGRLCAEAMEHRLVKRTGQPARGLRARPPLRPMAVAALIGPERGEPLALPAKRG